MTSVVFTVANTTTVVDAVVVVNPLLADADGGAKLVTWRVLAPAPQGFARFTFGGAISARATDGTLSTARVDVQPGELLSITSTPAGGLVLAPAGGAPTNDAAWVRNDSADARELNVVWFVDRSRVMVERQVNHGALTSLALTATLLFSVRSEATGKISESPNVAYAIPPDAARVKVRWSRDGAAGADVFTFDPPSA